MVSQLAVETHFAFGENWQSFAKLLDDQRIVAAIDGMKRLFPNGELGGAEFLDIGCGSGLSSLAAARLGVAEIDAVDIDPQSVAATKEMLSPRADGIPWHARTQSVFDLDPAQRRYDIVYSWGALHHTGDMWRAVKCAADMVKPNGYLAISLYRKTPWCGFWVREKRFYSRASRPIQAIIRGLYKGAFFAHMLSYGGSPSEYARKYFKDRGMNFSHDVHDWLGGYPYESATAEEVRDFLRSLGFEIIREFAVEKARAPYWSTVCDEFVAIKKA